MGDVLGETSAFDLPAQRRRLVPRRGDGLVQGRRVLRDGDTFGVDITANGGFAGIACPWHPGITTCYRCPLPPERPNRPAPTGRFGRTHVRRRAPPVAVRLRARGHGLEFGQ
ncbi:hypothetical protein ABT288_08015 [Streptomyces sp. NPDC001093]|uniref:hypothetical protein n=1 Tax=Streptomyces sp. NPDC001093 TaxID=3154376 RepID=UPI003326C03C